MKNLKLTPLEIITAPLFNSIRNRRERLLRSPHGNPYINPSLIFFKTRQARLKIVLIHVGKCAGESIMSYLRCALPSDCFALFEYHCFNSNQLIKQLLDEIKQDPSVAVIICTRDPLKRWEASFNWDYHNVVLSTTEPIHEFMRMIESFPRVQDLARAIVANDPQACAFGRLAHMGKGISWYVPLPLIDALPEGRTYIVRLETISDDLASLTRDLAMKHEIQDVEAPKHVPRTKANYKEAYPAQLFGDLKDLSQAEIKSMHDFLRDDYAVHQKLIGQIHQETCPASQPSS